MTDNELAIRDPSMLAQLGQAANQAAGEGIFGDYRTRKAANTLRRQRADLDLFADFLRLTGVQVGDFLHDPQAWHGITWGLVAAWRAWQLKQGYAIPTVNIRLSTIKVYAKMALQAGALSTEDYAMIRTVAGYDHKETKHVDDQRREAGIPTRCSTKKAQPVSITPDQAKALKAQPDTPQGRRDTLLMALMLDLGLRVGEVAILEREDFDLQAGELHFYRPKVDKVQTHQLHNGCLAAVKAYLTNDAPAVGIIWRGSRKGSGGLQETGWTERCMTERVRVLGEEIGLHGLSAHDCRHYWATQAARNHTPMDRLQDAGGWSSLAMPARYIESARIANQGVNLGES